MIKKSFFIGALSLMAYGSAQATGFYVGAGLGALDMKTKLSSSTTVSVADTETLYEQDDFSSNVALNETLLLGYDWFFANHAFLGVEAFANHASSKTSNSINSNSIEVNSTMQLNTVYGLRLLPGFTIAPSTVVYGVIGYAVANTELNSTMNGNASDDALLNVTNNETKNLDGYQLGVGAMNKLSQHIAVRGDFIYTGYQETSFTSSSTNSVIINTYTLKPYTLEANVSLVYQFGGV